MSRSVRLSLLCFLPAAALASGRPGTDDDLGRTRPGPHCRWTGDCRCRLLLSAGFLHAYHPYRSSAATRLSALNLLRGMLLVAHATSTLTHERRPYRDRWTCPDPSPRNLALAATRISPHHAYFLYTLPSICHGIRALHQALHQAWIFRIQQHLHNHMEGNPCLSNTLASYHSALLMVSSGEGIVDAAAITYAFLPAVCWALPASVPHVCILHSPRQVIAPLLLYRAAQEHPVAGGVSPASARAAAQLVSWCDALIRPGDQLLSPAKVYG